MNMALSLRRFSLHTSACYSVLSCSSFLFHTVSNDTERENRYQAEISSADAFKQHQREPFQMYEDLTARQHDYKQHLQTLRELVSNDKDSTAEKYLNSVISDNLSDEMIVTGSPEIDALLTTKASNYA